MRAYRGIRRPVKDKIRPLRELLNIVSRLKKQGKRIVFTNGCFDLLHYGHAKYLEEAAEKGDILVVGVNSDSSVNRIKGSNRPIVTEKNRLKLIASLESVDFALIFKENTPIKLIKKVCPDILVKGADWNKDEIVGGSFVKGSGGKVFTVKLCRGLSTTNLIKRIVKTH